MMLRTGNKGISLIEVLITVAILSIGVTAVLRAYIVLLGAISSCQENITSLSLAKEKMTEILISNLSEKDFKVVTAQGNFQGQYKDFKWQSQVTASDIEKVDLLTVKVTNDENFNNAIALLNYVQKSEE